MRVTGLLTGFLLLALCGTEPAFACGGRIFKLVRSDGWEVPDTASMQQVAIRNADGSPVSVENATAYVPKETMHLDFVVVSRTDTTPPNVLNYSLSKLPVGTVRKYEVNKRVVAYYIVFDLRSSGSGMPGCVLDATIYDEDGDGKFETYQPFSGSPQIPKLTNK